MGLIVERGFDRSLRTSIEALLMLLVRDVSRLSKSNGLNKFRSTGGA